MATWNALKPLETDGRAHRIFRYDNHAGLMGVQKHRVVYGSLEPTQSKSRPQYGGNPCCIGASPRVMVGALGSPTLQSYLYMGSDWVGAPW